MGLNSIVTGLETSKKLKSLGLYSDHLFKWAVYKGSKTTGNEVLECKYFRNVPKDQDIPAYTFQDLWDVLPKILDVKQRNYYLCLGFGIYGESIGYPELVQHLGCDMDFPLLNEDDEKISLAEAAANLLIKLIERDYLGIGEEK